MTFVYLKSLFQPLKRKQVAEMEMQEPQIFIWSLLIAPEPIQSNLNDGESVPQKIDNRAQKKKNEWLRAKIS